MLGENKRPWCIRSVSYATIGAPLSVSASLNRRSWHSRWHHTHSMPHLSPLPWLPSCHHPSTETRLQAGVLCATACQPCATGYLGWSLQLWEGKAPCPHLKRASRCQPPPLPCKFSKNEITFFFSDLCLLASIEENFGPRQTGIKLKALCPDAYSSFLEGDHLCLISRRETEAVGMRFSQSTWM